MSIINLKTMSVLDEQCFLKLAWPLKIGIPKWKGSSSNHPFFWGYVSFREGTMKLLLTHFKKDSYRCAIIWATGKTLIAKCDLGSKLSFSGVRYIVLQCFLPPSKRSPLKCMQEHFSQRHVRFCSVFHCFALILLVRIDRLKSKDFSYEPFDFWGIHHVKAFYAEMVIVWLSFWLSFNPM